MGNRIIRKYIVPLSVPFSAESECCIEYSRAMREGNRPNSFTSGKGECLHQNYGADAASGVPPAALQHLLPGPSVASGAVTSRQEATRLIGREVTTCRVKARIGRSG